MNIAILIPSLAGGGAERVAQTIGDYFSDSGHVVYYLLLDTGLSDVYHVKGSVIRTGIKEYPTLTGNLLEKHIAWFHRVKLVKHYKQKYHIHAAISFMEECNSLNVLSRTGEKVIISIRTSLAAYENVPLTIYQRKWMREVYQQADEIVAVSKYVKKELKEKCGIKKKITVIPNPAIRYENGNEKLQWPYGEKAIICAGRLSPVKQPDRIVRIFSYVVKHEPDARLIFIGEGELKGYLMQLCNHHDISDSIVFAGFVGNVGYYYKNGRAFLMASKWEGFPNAMVEAMSYGLPIVTMDSPGGCGEIVGKESDAFETRHCRYGILTPYVTGKPKWSEQLSKEEVATAEAVLEVLNNDETYEYYHRQSLKRTKHYSMEKTMACWDRVIKK